VSCSKCSYFSCDSEGYVECSVNPSWANLKSFPFTKLKDCFRLEFWHSEFADQLQFDDEKDKLVFKAYREKYPVKIKAKQ
jgi:hypothetical protein